MAYRAPAEGFSEGMQGGVNILRGLTDLQRAPAIEQRAQEEHQQRMAEGAQRIESSKQTQARQNDVDALNLSKDDLADITRQHQGVIQTYGSWDRVPQDQASAIGAKYRQWQTNHAQLLDRARGRLMGWVNDGRQTARDMANNQTPPSKVDSKKLVNSIAVNTGMDPSDFLDGPNGEPSPLRQAGDQIVRAGESGNWNEVVPAANVLLKGELRQGVGTMGKDGTPITGKEIVSFVPAQGGGDQVYPVLRVKTQGHPEGYTAPVTQDRSSDPNDPPIPVSLNKLIDRLQHVSTLTETLNHPDFAAKIQDGMSGKNGDDVRANLDAFAQLPQGKAKVKFEDVQRGNIVTRIKTREDTGEELGREDLTKGVDPAVEARLGALEKVANIRAGATTQAATTRATSPDRRTQTKLDALDDMRDNNEITPEEYKQRKLDIISGAPKAGGSAATKPLSEAEIRNRGEEAVKKKAGELGLTYNTGMKTYTRDVPSTKDPSKSVPRPLSMDADGRSIQSQLDKARDEAVTGLRKQNDSLRSRGGGINTAPAGGGPPQVTSEDDYNKLPAGSTYIAPDGSTRRKK